MNKQTDKKQAARSWQPQTAEQVMLDLRVKRSGPMLGVEST